MDEPRDPLDALREAWRSLPPPAAHAPLEEEDPLTRRCVVRLRRAWRALEAPAPGRPPWVRRARRRRLVTAAAAAVVLIAAGAAFRLARRGGVREPAAPAGPAAPDVLAAGDERVVMRSGPVTLVLVRPQASGGDD